MSSFSKTSPSLPQRCSTPLSWLSSSDSLSSLFHIDDEIFQFEQSDCIGIKSSSSSQRLNDCLYRFGDLIEKTRLITCENNSEIFDIQQVIEPIQTAMGSLQNFLDEFSPLNSGHENICRNCQQSSVRVNSRQRSSVTVYMPNSNETSATNSSSTTSSISSSTLLAFDDKLIKLIYGLKKNHSHITTNPDSHLRMLSAAHHFRATLRHWFKNLDDLLNKFDQLEKQFTIVSIGEDMMHDYVHEFLTSMTKLKIECMTRLKRFANSHSKILQSDFDDDFNDDDEHSLPTKHTHHHLNGTAELGQATDRHYYGRHQNGRKKHRHNFTVDDHIGNNKEEIEIKNSVEEVWNYVHLRSDKHKEVMINSSWKQRKSKKQVDIEDYLHTRKDVTKDVEKYARRKRLLEQLQTFEKELNSQFASFQIRPSSSTVTPFTIEKKLKQLCEVMQLFDSDVHLDEEFGAVLSSYAVKIDQWWSRLARLEAQTPLNEKSINNFEGNNQQSGGSSSPPMEENGDEPNEEEEEEKKEQQQEKHIQNNDYDDQQKLPQLKEVKNITSCSSEKPSSAIVDNNKTDDHDHDYIIDNINQNEQYNDDNEVIVDIDENVYLNFFRNNTCHKQEEEQQQKAASSSSCDQKAVHNEIAVVDHSVEVESKVDTATKSELISDSSIISTTSTLVPPPNNVQAKDEIDFETRLSKLEARLLSLLAQERPTQEELEEADAIIFSMIEIISVYNQMSPSKSDRWFERMPQLWNQYYAVSDRSFATNDKQDFSNKVDDVLDQPQEKHDKTSMKHDDEENENEKEKVEEKQVNEANDENKVLEDVFKNEDAGAEAIWVQCYTEPINMDDFANSGEHLVNNKNII